MRFPRLLIAAVWLMTSFAATTAATTEHPSLLQQAKMDNVGYELEVILNKNGHETLYGWLNKAELSKRIFDKLPGNKNDRRDQSTRLSRYLDSVFWLLTGGHDSEKQLEWRYLGIQADPKRPGSIQIITQTSLPKYGLVDYMGLVIDELDAERPIVDVYFYQTNSYLSDQLKEALSLPLMLKADQRKNYIRLLDAYYQLDRDKLRSLHAKLPKFLQQSAHGIGAHLAYGVYGTADERKQAFAALYARYKNNPDWAAAMIGHHLVSKQYDMALKSSEVLFERIGGTHSAEHGFRGYIHYAKGDYQKALQELQQGIKLDPYYDLNYNNLKLVYVALGSDAKAIEVLEALQQRFGQRWDKPSFTPWQDNVGVKRFLDSAGYNDWLKKSEVAKGNTAEEFE